MCLNLIISIVSICFFALSGVAHKTPIGSFFTSSVAAENQGSPRKWERWRDFASEHFRYPLPPMGEAPDSYEGAQRSLLPENCGSCHPVQYEQWKTTFHAKAMSPGVYGQLVDMWMTNPEQAQSCNECHAPLAEQQKRVKSGAGPVAVWRKNPAHDRKLEMSGLTCAGCHVRNWRVYGPLKEETPANASGTKRNVVRTQEWSERLFSAVRNFA